MENYLFLLELFVDTVTLSSNLPEYPRASDVIVSGELAKFIKMEVYTVQDQPESNYNYNKIKVENKN